MLDNKISYELVNYSSYQRRILNLLKDPVLKKMGLKRESLGKTVFGYDIDCLTIGNGNKHLFLVGGSHGSEIIGVDFVTQYVNHLKETFNGQEEILLDTFKLFIIPLQNPEGFIVSSSTLTGIEEDFREKSYEYYLRYRTDNVVALAFKELNSYLNEVEGRLGFSGVNAEYYLQMFKKFIENDVFWKRLADVKVMPGIERFNNEVRSWDYARDLEADVFFSDLSCLCDKMIKEIIDKEKTGNGELGDVFLLEFMNVLKDYFEEGFFRKEVKVEKKFHHEMFSKVDFSLIKDVNLASYVGGYYKLNKHPKGSQVTHDANGLGINLNANSPINPGIDVIKNGGVSYALSGARNNLRNYVVGPLGVPCLAVDNFEYAMENRVLYDLIKKSYEAGNYVGTFLFHGTGGLVYWKPYEELMNHLDYQYVCDYNQEIASIYEEATEYKMISGSDWTGYGDLLRSKFPGVFLIELSKMGGNPIAPYGDINNIYNTFVNNFRALDKILEHMESKKVKTRKLVNSKVDRK